MTSRIACWAANLAIREVLFGRCHLPVRDRRAYNIAVERAEDAAIRTQLERQNPVCLS